MRVALAGCVLEIQPKYDYSEKFFEDYITNEPVTQGLPVIQVSDEEIEAENDNYEANFLKGYLETLAIQRRIAGLLANKDIILLHGVAFTYEDTCYIVTARSGTGKSTHIMLWQKYLGSDRVKIINGDKPFIRREGDEFTVYGTPWCGKEGYNINTSSRLGGIIFLDRGSECKAQRLNQAQIIPRLLGQVHIPDEKAKEVLGVCDGIVKNVPCYGLACDISQEAVKVCYEAVTGREYKG